MRGARAVVTATFVVLAAACGAEAPPAPTASVRDSSGVRIVTYDASVVEAPLYRRLGAHDLQIGVQDGDPEYTFSRIVGVGTFADGAIVVADRGATNLRVYDAAGEHRGTLGGEGDGPGEMADLTSLVDVAGDTVFVWDSRARRVTAFHRDGSLVETVSMTSESAGRPVRLVRAPDGTYLSRSRWLPPGRAPGGFHDLRLEVDSMVVERLASDGALVDTVDIITDAEWARSIAGADGRISVRTTSRPLGSSSFVEARGGEALIARTSAFVLRELGPQGPSGLLRVEGMRRETTAADIERARQNELDRITSLGDVTPEYRAWIDELFDLPAPDSLPAFSELRVTSIGDAWVALFEAAPGASTTWLVFSPEHEMLGRVITPPGLEVMHVTDRAVYGVVEDAFDVPYVRRYPFDSDG